MNSNNKSKRWTAYAAAGAAAAISGVHTAEAEIVHMLVGSPDGDFNPTLAVPGEVTVMLPLEGGASLSMDVSAGGNFPVFGLNDGVYGNVAGATTSYNFAYNLNSGDNISTQVFTGPRLGLMALFSFSGNFVDQGGYGAFRFDLDDDMEYQYGWVRFSDDGLAGVNGYTVEEYAWGMENEAVAVGQTASIPEPSSLGMMALGAVGLMTSRRKRLAAA